MQFSFSFFLAFVLSISYDWVFCSGSNYVLFDTYFRRNTISTRRIIGIHSSLDYNLYNNLHLLFLMDTSMASYPINLKSESTGSSPHAPPPPRSHNSSKSTSSRSTSTYIRGNTSRRTCSWMRLGKSCSMRKCGRMRIGIG